MAKAYIVTNKSGNRSGVSKKRYQELKSKGYDCEIVDVGESESEYPKKTGAGWYELSNGESVRGEEQAQKQEDNL